MHISFYYLTNPAIIYFIIFIFGLIFGSFIGALSYRLPLNISIIKKSSCINCNKNLKITDLFPLISYIIKRGKCGYCNNKISIRYFLIEISTSLFLLLNFFILGLNYIAIITALLLLVLIVIIIIDIEHRIIPDSLQIALIIIGMVINYFYNRSLFEILITIISYGLFAIILRFLFLKLCKKDALGFGDIKFFFITGLFIHYQYFSTFLLFSGLIGIIFGLYWKLVKKEDLFPFAPALAISLYVTLIFQELGFYVYLSEIKGW